jgi:hypothetical protein
MGNLALRLSSILCLILFQNVLSTIFRYFCFIPSRLVEQIYSVHEKQTFVTMETLIMKISNT